MRCLRDSKGTSPRYNGRSCSFKNFPNGGITNGSSRTAASASADAGFVGGASNPATVFSSKGGSLLAAANNERTSSSRLFVSFSSSSAFCLACSALTLGKSRGSCVINSSSSKSCANGRACGPGSSCSIPSVIARASASTCCMSDAARGSTFSLAGSAWPGSAPARRFRATCSSCSRSMSICMAAMYRPARASAPFTSVDRTQQWLLPVEVQPAVEAQLCEIWESGACSSVSC
mmetsp:Transcript_100192/g.188808  ORF Transcript_100192/g.188808 Transcript_100192/m.188808 type:complete len:233 (-) Transcript_100192:1608-2306(-)